MSDNAPFSPRAVGGLVLAGSLALAGCQNMDMGNLSPTQRNAAIGAGIGALGGAAIGGNAKGAAIGAGVGALGGYIWSQQMQQRKQAMERATVGTGVAVTQTPDNQLKLNIPSDISFDVDRANIKPRLQPVLDQFASGLGQMPNAQVRIIGYTDSTGSADYNERLSLQRALATREYLAARGVDPRRITISGAGESNPVASNATEAGRARNRRVEIFLGEPANVAQR